MIVVIDNYDSFTYNLVQFLGELGADIEVYRNDQITLAELQDRKPDHLVVSPGPGTPQEDSGISNEAIKALGQEIPVLGVCLGNQCIGHIFGGEVKGAPRIMHGKTSLIHHDGKGLFAGIRNPFEATRYHSLIVYEPIPEELEITARTKEGEIMGLRHKQYPIHGVQFHPESFLTEQGKDLLGNFLGMTAS